MRKVEFLQQWEEELSSYSNGVRGAIIILVPTIILWLGWELWISSLLEDMDNSSDKIINLERDISKISPKRFEKKISILQNRENRIKKSIEDSRYRLRHLESKAYRYNFLWFDENRFLMILKKILKYSVKLRIKIDKIESIPIQKRKISPYIAIKKMIEIDGVGNYADIIKMLYYIDSFNVLLEIESIEILLEKSELKFRIVITQYGIEV